MASRQTSDSLASPIPRWLPNAISVLRILLVPVWLLCAEACRGAAAEEMAVEAGRWRVWAVVVLLSIGLSDVIDGWLARRFSLTSRTGATLDALADKLCQVVLVTWLALRAEPGFDPIPIWFLVLLILRDVLLATGWVVIKNRVGKVHVVHQVHGKAASLLLFLLLFGITADLGTGLVAPATWLIAGIVTLSTIGYARDGFRQLREALASHSGR